MNRLRCRPRRVGARGIGFFPLLALLGAVLGVSGCAGDGSPDAERAVAASTEASSEARRADPDVEPAVRRQLAVAEQRVQDAATADPAARAAAFGELAQLQHAYDLDSAAAESYRAARDLAPDVWEWSYGLALLALERGETAAARRALDATLATGAADAAVRSRLAALDLEAAAVASSGGEPTSRAERLAAAEAGFASRPGDAWSLRGLGRVALARDDLEAARAAFEAALAVQPGADRLHYELAQVERRAGDLERARWHLERFGPTEPQLGDPYLRRLERLRTGTAATLHRAVGAFLANRPQEAVDLLAPLGEERARDPQLTSAYTAALLVTSPERALSELETAIEQFPGAAELHLQLATAQVRSGHRAAALAALETVVRLEPANESARLLQADLLRQSGRPAEAIEPYRQALSRQPENVLARLYLGSSLAATGALDEAAVELEQALQLAPADPRARDELARVEVGRAERARKRGDEGAAIAAAEAAHRLLPDDPDLRRGLARLLSTARAPAVRDGRRALVLIEPVFAVARSPYDAEIVAMAHAAAGDFSTALEWQRALVAEAGRSRDPALAERFRRNLLRFERGEIAEFDG